MTNKELLALKPEEMTEDEAHAFAIEALKHEIKWMNIEIPVTAFLFSLLY